MNEILATWWVGPLDEVELQRAWATFGSDLPAAVDARPALWTTCLERGMDPRRIKAAGVWALPKQFERDVKTRSSGFPRSFGSEEAASPTTARARRATCNASSISSTRRSWLGPLPLR